jgi:hypothetical protein
LQIPAPETKNNDHNPPALRRTTFFDLAVGRDNRIGSDRYKVGARLTVINLPDKEANPTFSVEHSIM